MTAAIIIAICSLLLLAYLFDISSALTKIPSVILLLTLGWVVKQATIFFQVRITDLNPLLPIFGTIGLILIVLEGALELELNKTKIPVIKKATIMALLPIFIIAFLLAWVFQYYAQVPYNTALVNAIPFCVISSAIAIPSARNISEKDREFVIYESSLSDIFGVLLFNFFALNEIIDAASFGKFGFDLITVIVLSFIAVLGLSFLLSRIKHHVTYTPIILLVILIYAISKVYHLPGLIFILVFGLFLGNLDELKHIKLLEKFRPQKLQTEVHKFKEITIEATFIIRALFFILFGFLIDSEKILALDSLPWAVGIVAAVLLVRTIALLFAKLPLLPLLFIAPRGLITILLFISIAPALSISLVNNSLIIQTILISVLVMMFGLIFSKKPV